MTVDIRLNQMIDALDGRLKAIMLQDVELSIRTYKALRDCGARTLHDAQMALIDRTIHKQHGIGPRAIKEIEEIICNVLITLPRDTSPVASHETPDVSDKIERKALVERLREVTDWWRAPGLMAEQAAALIEADGQRIAELEAALNGLLDEITLNKGDVLDSRAAGMAYAALLLGGKG